MHEVFFFDFKARTAFRRGFDGGGGRGYFDFGVFSNKENRGQAALMFGVFVFFAFFVFVFAFFDAEFGAFAGQLFFAEIVINRFDSGVSVFVFAIEAFEVDENGAVVRAAGVV